MRLSPGSVLRTGQLVALLSLLAGTGSPSCAQDLTAADSTAHLLEVTNPEVAGTLKMMAAHAPLRTSEVADADSPTNRRIFRGMIQKFLQTSATAPFNLPEIAPASAPLVATLTGKFSVDNKGAAQYSIPLRIPEGRGGLEPSLSVSYYSPSGQGTMGRGFYVSTGFNDSIDRGRTLLARDDVVRSKELGARDFFYLDGKRLICVSAPRSYGQPGSEYRTEVDSFVRIYASGTGDTIETFTMIDRWGRTSVFGKYEGSEDGLHRGHDEATSRPARLPMRFALKQVRDPLGNFIAFTYADMGFGEWVLSRIDYTGGADLAPSNRIEFNYTPRHPRVPKYDTGLREDTAHRLDSIRVRTAHNGATVALYSLEYARTAGGIIDHLTAIHSQLADDVSALLQAAAPLRLFWSKEGSPNRPPLNLAATLAPPDAAANPLLVPGDFDGDGKTDLLTFTQGLTVALSTIRGAQRTQSQWLAGDVITRELPGSPEIAAHTADFDCDGRTDVLLVASSGRILPARSDGRKFTPLAVVDVSSHLPVSIPGETTVEDSIDLVLKRVLPGDVNGDGRDDIIVFGRERLPQVFISQGSSFAAPARDASGPAETSSITHYLDGLVEDLNGDGCEDLVWLERAPDSSGDDETRLCYAIIQPEGAMGPPRVIHAWTASSELPAVIMADFNDDGLPDFLADSPAPSQSHRWTAYLNRGNPTGPGGDNREMFTRVDNAVAAGPQGPMSGSEARLRSNSPSVERSDAPARLHGSLRPVLGKGDPLSAIDVDDDSLRDLVWFVPSAEGGHGAWWACHGNGDGTFRAPAPLAGPIWTRFQKAADLTPSHTMSVATSYDFNGDGAYEWTLERGDLFDQSSVVAVLGPNLLGRDGGPFDVVTGFVDGMGEFVHARYKAARDDSVYLPGAPVAYPICELRTAKPVVSDIWRDTGGAGYSQFSYQYSGNRNDLSGRGPLGFASFATFDRQTRFFKYQHLAQSYPLTGLTAREETHWYWVQSGSMLFKCSSKEDHTVVCDFVVDPITREPYGTVLSFVSQSTESRWRADLEPDATVPSTDANGLDGITRLFAPSAQPPVTQTTTTTWRDLQDTTQAPPMRYPRVEVSHPLAAGYDGAMPRVSAGLLHGGITQGNETRNLVTHQSGDFEDTVETFRPPRHAADPLTAQRETTRITKKKGSDPAIPGPLTSYRYFGDTTLLASETVESTASATGEETGNVTETVLERDERGRLVRRIVRTSIAARADEAPEEDVTYQALAFDDATDQPTRIIDPEDGDRSVRYHPLLHRAAVITYDQGGIVEYSYDGFGRTRRVQNPKNDYLRTTDFAWTTSDGEGWRQTQVVSGPAQARGLPIASVYAERTAKSGSTTFTNYRDRTGRVIRVMEEAAEGSVHFTDTVFNGLGQTVAESKPYAPGGAQTWTVTRYDSYGISYPSEEIRVPGSAGDSPIEAEEQKN